MRFAAQGPSWRGNVRRVGRNGGRHARQIGPCNERRWRSRSPPASPPRGLGPSRCAKLAKDMNPSEGFNNMANALIYFWVQGYMSAANITTLESDSEYVDLAKFDETVMLPMLHEFCTKNPDKKPISLIDSLLDKTAKLS